MFSTLEMSLSIFCNDPLWKIAIWWVLLFNWFFFFDSFHFPLMLPFCDSVHCFLFFFSISWVLCSTVFLYFEYSHFSSCWHCWHSFHDLCLQVGFMILDNMTWQAHLNCLPFCFFENLWVPDCRSKKTKNKTKNNYFQCLCIFQIVTCSHQMSLNLLCYRQKQSVGVYLGVFRFLQN